MKKSFLIIVLSVFFCSFISVSIAAAQNITLLDVKGEVKYASSGQKDVLSLEMEIKLKDGDKIITGENSYVIISIDEQRQRIVKIKEKTEVILKIVSDKQLYLIDGGLLVFLENPEDKETFTVKTPTAVCGARGTGWLVKATDLMTDIIVFDGTVFVQSIDKDLQVKKKKYYVYKGYSREIMRLKDPEKLKSVSKDTIAELKEEMALILKSLELANEPDESLNSILLDENKMEAMQNKLEKSDYRVNHSLDRFGEMKPMPSSLPAGRDDKDRRN